ncbi:hypothetical protein M8C21_031272 [Ambrosia artemisiifolia]|uniref:Germin-like protein n=1 Tax=Ambrosia artemisiifolia TaxID=4212 RepID=A0AAD5CWY3_AMBAR|nr:hypothetical protein M8C21_031272 [Ambrosia artemisiifolia]
MSNKLIILSFVALTFACLAFAYEPKPLQDFCVADPNTSGTLRVGFVTSNPDNRFITKVLQKGDVFVFPVGLVHFQQNVGNGYAVAIAALSSQNPGAITIANAVFGANPPIPGDILAKAFQVDKSVVDKLQSKF